MHSPENKSEASQDGTIAQNWASYTPEEHAVWKTLYERQFKLLPGRASDAFLDGMQRLPMDASQIPDFEQLNKVLFPTTGWRVVAVPGLIADDIFFEHLANRRFPAGRFIRQPHQLDYLEEPDVFHDVFGHVPMLMNRTLADYIQAYGAGGLKAKKLGMLEKLARVYWYTVEFGLIQQADGLRIYGAGIASSYSESIFALDDASPNRVLFDLERVMQTQYRIDDFQETYFAVKNMEQLLELAHIDFTNTYQRLQGSVDLEPGQLLATDHVLTHGTRAYHAAKQLQK